MEDSLQEMNTMVEVEGQVDKKHEAPVKKGRRKGKKKKEGGNQNENKEGDEKVKRSKKKKRKSKVERAREKERLQAAQDELKASNTWRRKVQDAWTLKKAKIKLSVKKARAARRKHIPFETRVVGPKKTSTSPYDNYFLNQVEPGKKINEYWIFIICIFE